MDSQLVVACDLFENQKLYQVPDWAEKSLRSAFPHLTLLKVHPNKRSKSLEQQAVVYWGNYFTQDILDRMPNLRWIHCASVGVNRVAIPEVCARGIRVTNSRGLLTAPVAATVVAMICSLARGLHYAWWLRTRGELNRDKFDQFFERMQLSLSGRCLPEAISTGAVAGDVVHLTGVVRPQQAGRHVGGARHVVPGVVRGDDENRTRAVVHTRD